MSCGATSLTSLMFTTRNALSTVVFDTQLALRSSFPVSGIMPKKSNALWRTIAHSATMITAAPLLQ